MYYDDFDLTDLMIRKSLIRQAIADVKDDILMMTDDKELILNYLNYDLKMVEGAINARVEQLREGSGNEEVRGEITQ